MIVVIKNGRYHPGWCGSADSVMACKQKGRRFNSQSGHMPGLWARSLVGGVREATNPCISHTLMSLSLPFSFPSSLSKGNFFF